ncbi:MAG: DEAD/DEAH box helicase [Thermoguttaceae bacterium]
MQLMTGDGIDTLTNKRALSLAEERGYIQKDYVSRLPSVLRLDSIRRAIESTVITANNEHLFFNRFQISLWNAMYKAGWVSVSAPTSTGKSFAIGHWVCEYFSSVDSGVVIYLVPTRALIQQVQDDLSKFIKDAKVKVNIGVFPQASTIKDGERNLLVFTQERLHLFLNNTTSNQKIDFLIVDEAHKFEDDARGILLEQVIDQVLQRNSSVKVLLACPFVDNPERLLKQAPTQTITTPILSEHITVNQNLIWATQKSGKPKEWELNLIHGDSTPLILGELHLAQRPIPESKKLPLLAVAHGEKGSLIYVNDQSSAEKAALFLCDLLRDENTQVDEAVSSLIDLVRKSIHPNYALCTALKKRIGFHYGNIPLIVKTEIERLFKENKIHYLVCTSTLIEGVNLPCKTIFLSNPSRGRSKSLTDFDFWNLAGRAGRLGSEFQGNIICVEPKRWISPPPKEKKSFSVQPATQKILERPDNFIDYCTSRVKGTVDNNPQYEQLISYLITEQYIKDGSNSHVWDCIPSSQIETLKQQLDEMISKTELPMEILQRNPGINPLGMRALVGAISRHSKIESILPPPPESDDAVEIYNAIFKLIDENIAPVFAGKGGEGRRKMLAILVVQWMRGYPLKRLISSRISFAKKPEAAAIRETMGDVEQYARFSTPKYLSCYIDLLKHFSENEGKSDIMSSVSYSDINMWLEFGVSSKTHISLMSLGLSRTSAILLSDFIANMDMNETEAKEWLIKSIPEGAEIPLAVQREIDRALSK